MTRDQHLLPYRGGHVVALLGEDRLYLAPAEKLGVKACAFDPKRGVNITPLTYAADDLFPLDAHEDELYRLIRLHLNAEEPEPCLPDWN